MITLPIRMLKNYHNDFDIVISAAVIYIAYASKSLNKQRLQLQSSLLEMSTPYYSMHGKARIVDAVHSAISSWAALSTKCAACTLVGQTGKSKDHVCGYHGR